MTYEATVWKEATFMKVVAMSIARAGRPAWRKKQQFRITRRVCARSMVRVLSAYRNDPNAPTVAAQLATQ